MTTGQRLAFFLGAVVLCTALLMLLSAAGSGPEVPVPNVAGLAILGVILMGAALARSRS